MPSNPALLIKSYKDVAEFARASGPYCSYLVAAALKDFHAVNDVFTKDGPVCYRESATYTAAYKREDLPGRFNETRAVAAWLHYIEKFTGRVAKYGKPEKVLVDWVSLVFRYNDEGNAVFGCVVDIQHGLRDSASRSGSSPVSPP